MVGFCELFVSVRKMAKTLTEKQKNRGDKCHCGLPKLGYKDSNLELTESESVALPFGDSPITKCHISAAQR